MKFCVFLYVCHLMLTQIDDTFLRTVLKTDNAWMQPKPPHTFLTCSMVVLGQGPRSMCSWSGWPHPTIVASVVCWLPSWNSPSHSPSQRCAIPLPAHLFTPSSLSCSLKRDKRLYTQWGWCYINSLPRSCPTQLKTLWFPQRLPTGLM